MAPREKIALKPAPERGVEDQMTASPMPAEKFWHIMQRAAESRHDPDAHVNALRALLRELTLEEIISFEVAFRRYLNKAYTWTSGARRT